MELMIHLWKYSGILLSLQIFIMAQKLLSYPSRTEGSSSPSTPHLKDSAHVAALPSWLFSFLCPNLALHLAQVLLLHSQVLGLYFTSLFRVSIWNLTSAICYSGCLMILAHTSSVSFELANFLWASNIIKQVIVLISEKKNWGLKTLMGI